MTVQEKLEKMLIERFLTESVAKEIIECVKADIANEPMEKRWSNNIEGYPVQLLSALWDSTKRHALEWIDENLPLAWFRPLFVEEQEKE